MWKLKNGGGAINTANGEKIFTKLGTNGLVRVYREKKIISVYHSVSAANNFIEKLVTELNGVDNQNDNP